MVKPATPVVVCGLIVAGLATVAALAGLFWPAEAASPPWCGSFR